MARRYVRQLRLPPQSKILDFGCGTGLYTGLLLDEGLGYHGFDIDERFVTFARMLYPAGFFHSNWADVAAAGPFALVVANCCFHHISDEDASTAFERIRSVLAPDGRFLFIDHLPPSQQSVSRARRTYRLLERGEHIRSVQEYQRLIGAQMIVRTTAIERSYVFSLPTRFNPLYNELVVCQCGVDQIAANETAV
jgi:SAM-dependent methyltransferase